MQLNFNRNARHVDTVHNQLATGKRIIFPSDDPILAGRALKFRTSVFETEQYQRNVGQGLSWMEITEGAFRNVTNIVGRIRELLVQGASDENGFSDRQKIVTDIQQLVNQLGTEMNVSYAGRFVFSGFRTDQPPVIQRDDPDAHFNITQLFSGKDVEKIDVLQLNNTPGGSTFNYVSDLDVIKLAYSKGVDALSVSVNVPVTVRVFDSLADAPASFDPGDPDTMAPNEVFFFRDTGDVHRGGNVPADVDVVSFPATPDEADLDGLAPNEIAFCETTGTLLPGNRFSAAASTAVQTFPSLNDDGSVPPAPVDLSALGPDDIFYIEDTGTFILGSDLALQMRAGNLSLEINYDKTGLDKGDLNPMVYFDVIDLTTTPPRPYNMNDQDMQYEFGVATRININSLALNVYTDKMFADLMDFCRLFRETPTNTLDTIMAANPGMSEADAKEILQTEQDQLRRMSQQRFNSLLGLIDAHNSGIMRENTDLGSRMNRLELIEARLEEDRINFRRLLSDNEDVDYTEAAMEMHLAETVYQAALQVGARVMQMSLADFIR